MRSGHAAVAGVDEVGRGALAGPVVAAAVILAPERCPDGLDDSKKLSPEVRTALYRLILDAATAVSVYYASPRCIDTINILRASQVAMCRSISALHIRPAMALVDGLPISGSPCPHQAIVRGDSLECCIAAASIVAKVTRDNLMCAYALHYPEYGFDRHKGYATPAHRRAIMEHGLCAIHRRSFTREICGSHQQALTL